MANPEAYGGARHIAAGIIGTEHLDAAQQSLLWRKLRHGYIEAETYRLYIEHDGTGTTTPDGLRDAYLGFLLHDVGTALQGNRWYMREPGPADHVRDGIRMLAGYDLPPDVRTVIGCHHERLDGTGYPFGLRGGEIPYLGRMAAIIDKFVSACEGRPAVPGCVCRGPVGWETALDMLGGYSGALDSSLLDSFREAVYRTFPDSGYMTAHYPGLSWMASVRR